MPRKTFVAGEVLAATDVNTYLMDQAVMTFAGSAARGSAIASPSEGMVSYLEDTDLVEVYDSTNWVQVGGTQPGNVIQVVSTAKTDQFSTTSATFVDITGLSVTITPSSTGSKILLMAHLPLASSDNTESAALVRFSGGNSGNFVGNAASNREQVAAMGGVREVTANASLMYNAAPQFLDSPSTTSAITYKVQMRRGNNGTAYLNRTAPDVDSASYARSAASITAMEIAG